MLRPVMTTAQKGCLSFYYHRRDRGGVSQHHHDAHQISITIGRPVDVCWWTASSGDVHLTAAEGNVIVNPAGEPHAGRWDGAWENVGFYIERTLVETVARDLGKVRGRAQVRPTCQGGDSATFGLARMLLQEIDTDPLSCKLYAESLANVLAVRLLSGHLQAREVFRGDANALPQSAMRRVEAFIEENLEHNLSVSDIAAVVPLSAFYFSRRFKARTGMSPYEYVTRKRVERARWLLNRTTLPIAEISYQVGFSSQSHLCVRFRKLLGITPKRYREQL